MSIEIGALAPDSIEKVVALPLLEGEVRQLDKTETAVLMMLLTTGSDQKQVDEFLKAIDKKDPSAAHMIRDGMAILEKRLAWAGYTNVEPGAILYLSFVMNAVPGRLVMMTAIVAYYCKKNSLEKFTLKNAVEMFPVGVPTDDQLNKVWDDQKYREEANPMYDNGIDRIYAWSSIVGEIEAQ